MSADRLYYHDSRLIEFEARRVAASDDGLTVVLDRTAFYPTSGGQPHDLGTLAGVAVLGVEEDTEGRVAHRLAGAVGGEVLEGRVDWARRFDHMQQHTGQHLLSAVFAELYGFATVSVHMGDVCTIDLATPVLTQEQIEAVERRANEIVAECRPVTVSFEDAAEAQGLRKASERAGMLRIVTIERLDRSACGGTHVGSTGEIGPALIRKLDKMRGNVRVEFVCGGRAIARVREDYNALAAISRTLTASFEEAPALVAAQAGRLQDADKARRKALSDLAALRGEALWRAAAEASDGLRRYVHRGVVDDEVRALAQSFANGARAVFLGLSVDPPSVLYAASKDSGVNAGVVLKGILAECGGRGGGSPVMGQGSLPSADAVAMLEQRIKASWPNESI